MLLRIRNIDGWLLYKKDCVLLIDKSLKNAILYSESLGSCILRIEDFLINVPDRIAIYIRIENDEVIGLMILMVSDELNQYTNITIRSCCIYSYGIKIGYIWKFVKDSKLYTSLVYNYAKSMNCDKITCTSVRDWEKFGKRLFNLELKEQYKHFEINLDNGV